jgi:1-deoxy-D-xylulose-5-phosphate reductoisomerase
MKRLSVLGSTGSIGQSALDVVEAFPTRYEVVALAAGRSVEKLAQQAVKHRPELIAVAGAEEVKKLRALLPGGFSTRIVAGHEGLEEAAAHPSADVVVGGLVGALGLRSAYAAAAAGKRLALANKETLVVAGELILSTAKKHGAEIVPVDSEHCAIHQALRGGTKSEVDRLVLTASGGPFRKRELSTFESITVEDALAHPTWKMGPKITIDSATMMNKGLEIIEAHFLFDVAPEKIAVVIHPQSVIHSLVEFVDGSYLAQISINDMKFPILYAISYPERLANPFGRLDLVDVGKLEFFGLEEERYPLVGVARAALSEGGMPAVVNAANEIAVAAFLDGKISFPGIVRVVAETASAAGSVPSPGSLDEAEQIDQMARRRAAETVNSLSRKAKAVSVQGAFG